MYYSTISKNKINVSTICSMSHEYPFYYPHISQKKTPNQSALYSIRRRHVYYINNVYLASIKYTHIYKTKDWHFQNVFNYSPLQLYEKRNTPVSIFLNFVYAFRYFYIYIEKQFGARNIVNVFHPIYLFFVDRMYIYLSLQTFSTSIIFKN